MGVPAFFRWLSTKYPKIISSVKEEEPPIVDGVQLPLDISGPNPNDEEFDNLYLDMNGIVHPCSHPEDGPAPENEEEMMLAVFKYTERVVNMVRPRKVLMMAVDGVAPRAKMNQQRSRRFRSAQDAKEDAENKEELKRMLKASGQLSKEAAEAEPKKKWDYNVITPGTPFMHTLAESLRYWVAYKLNTDPAWKNIKVIISDASVPGEGEHKIMEFIRSQRRQPEHDPNTRHVIYGLDADLIMLGLATHEPHFRVLREDVFFQDNKKRTCKLCGQPGHLAHECKGEEKVKEGEFGEKEKSPTKKPFIWLHVNVLREYLEAELHVPNLPFRWDIERAIDDWVFLCFFVGNDFLPHFPSLEIREEGIDTLVAVWKDNLAVMGGYATKDGSVDLEKAQHILAGLAKQEDAIFKRRREIHVRREEGAKRRKLEADRRNERIRDDGSPSARGIPKHNRKDAPAFEDIYTFEAGERGLKILDGIEQDLQQRMKASKARSTNDANKSASAVLKETLLRRASANNQTLGADASPNGAEPAIETPPGSVGKRKADVLDEEAGTPGRHTPIQTRSSTNSDEPPPDDVRLWEEGYSNRYYERKFGVDPNDLGFRKKVAAAYVEGICWVLLYYMQGCPSWTWYYPYHYAPFAADFEGMGSWKIEFDRGEPFRPYEQLMGVLPAASNHAIPEPFRSLMSDIDSEIIDFYPEDFVIDLNGKRQKWQGVAILPFIDAERLLAAMKKRSHLLTEDEHARNELGEDVLLFSTNHDMYDQVVSNIYSKKQGDSKFPLNVQKSHGLSGTIGKDESWQAALVFPLTNKVMPDIPEDKSMSVTYKMPHSTTVHKSQLLRGVVLPPRALDAEDIEIVRRKSGKSGRSYGGAPLRGDFRNGRGRGGGPSGRIDYSNPFAAHINPNFVPPQGFPMPGMPGFPPPLTPGQFGNFPGMPPPPHIAAQMAASGWVPPPPGQYGQHQGQGHGQYGSRNGQYEGQQDGYDRGRQGGYGGGQQSGTSQQSGYGGGQQGGYGWRQDGRGGRGGGAGGNHGYGGRGGGGGNSGYGRGGGGGGNSGYARGRGNWGRGPR